MEIKEIKRARNKERPNNKTQTDIQTKKRKENTKHKWKNKKEQKKHDSRCEIYNQQVGWER